ncbi:MFS transporter [Chryseobacterium taichungense]|uniref:MFS transporter n=1 Tax=Chryseobacterium taichungense TaxID=295069 RepID=UPI0028AD468E|nr:MFS transporter [Chryseobacterium taichungense]
MDRKNIILILASVGTFVEALDIAIVNLTIPSIQGQFGIGAETVQWLQTLYVLFFGGFLIIGGKLSDQIGRRKIFLLGSLIFMLTSLGAGLSSSFESLAVFRALQGLGAAFIMPSAMSIVTNTFTGDQERNRAVGIFSSFAAIGSVLAVTLIFAYYYLPKDEVSEKSYKTDFLSGILLVLGLLSLTYGTHELIHIKENPLMIISSLFIAILLLMILSYRLKSVSQPLINLSLMKYRSLKVSSLSFLALGAFFIGFLFLISLMLQKDMNYSAAEAGLLLVPFSIMSALVAKFILPHISKRLNSAQMAVFGWLFMFNGSLLLLIALYIDHPLMLVLMAAACISGIGMTFCFTGLSVLGIEEINPSDYGVAASVGSTSYFLGAGIGLSFMTLMSQFFPSEWAVGNLSLIILLGYSLFALSTLFYFIIKNVKIRKSEITF